MSVKVIVRTEPEIFGHPSLRRAMEQAATFVRDLWLAKAPHVSGGYAYGLLRRDSITVRPGLIMVENHCPHAEWHEFGHRSFNLGLAMLQGSKRTRVSKEGYRYLPIRIGTMKGRKFRAESVAEGLKASYMKPQAARAGKHAYQTPKRLKTPMRVTSREGKLVCVSEKAIRKNPSKWRMPQSQGARLAQKLQREVEPIVKAMLRAAMEGERERAYSERGMNPSWYKKDARTQRPINAATKGNKHELRQRRSSS